MININMLVFIGIISQVVLLEKFRGIFVFWRLIMIVKKKFVDVENKNKSIVESF